MGRVPGGAEHELANGFRLYRQQLSGSGWQAGFSLRGVRHFRYFPDAAYGSAEAARRAAEQFASKDSELHRELLALRRRFEVRRNSRSYIPGVQRYSGERKRGPFWLAYWDDSQGRRHSRRFSIGRLGESQAFRLALNARKQGVRPFQERYEQVLKSLGLVAEKAARSRTGTGVRR